MNRRIICEKNPWPCEEHGSDPSNRDVVDRDSGDVVFCKKCLHEQNKLFQEDLKARPALDDRLASIPLSRISVLSDIWEIEEIFSSYDNEAKEFLCKRYRV